MSGTADQQMEMPCLGRPFQLGTLYDFRNDSLIPGVTLWGPQTLGTATCTKMEGSDFEVITEDSLNEKALHLDVSAGLKLSVLGGLVKAGGSGKFLYDRTTSKNQARVSLKYRATSRFEQLNMSQLGKFEYPRVFKDDIATHVVTGVLYGADAIFVFDRQVESSEKLKQVHGEMEANISALPSKSFKVEGKADLDLQKTRKIEMENCRCKFYGDFILSSNPTTYQDAVRVYQELPKLLGGAGYPNSVPKKVWLYPLSKLDSKVQRMVCEISSFLINDFQDLMESLHELEVRNNDLIRNEVCVYFAKIKGDLEKLKRLIGGYKVTMLKKMATLLPQVRGGGAKEAKLAELFEENVKSPFNIEQLSFWISSKEKEVGTLSVYLEELRKKQIQLAFSSSEMVSLTCGFDEDTIVCFDFNIPMKKDSCLQRMEEYLHGRTASKEPQVQKYWYRTQMMRQAFQRFVNFVKINASRQGVKYVATNGYTIESDNVGLMVVYEDGCLTQFEPPDQPGKPCPSKTTHNSVQLKWAKPKYGAQHVQFYTITYRAADDSPDQWCAQASDEECVEVTNLIPGSLCSFKIVAEITVGSSPASEVSEVRLPPGQPGKPHVHASEITYNSVQLNWSKPKHGADIVQSYTISCCFKGDSPVEQWCTQISSDECTVFTDLTPGSLYWFKVTANSPAGPSPASEVSEVRLPADQPGKPVASDATYNSVYLKWTKPKHGAETVQSYSISCQAVDNQCLDIRTTSKHEYVTVTKLTPKTVYTFKVRAECTAGYGPDSELSNPIETTLPPPGKPHSNVTHNSLQLNWEKPSHGADSVQFYTVSYCTGNHSLDQWDTKRTPVAVESIQLLSLLPKTVYYFKVRAESAAGPSPDSELSDPIETAPPISQPGKPKATKVTHDSITLNWEKPECGAEDVKYYILDYCTLDQQDRWFTYKRLGPQANVCLTGLQPKTIYVFKVRAESSMASSLDSKFSSPIETSKLPPPEKPYASNVSYKGFHVNWQKPDYGPILHYSVSYQAIHDPPDKWHTKKIVGDMTHFSFPAARGIFYTFKVAAVTSAGVSSDSELSEPIVTKAEPWGVKIFNSLRPIPINSNPPTYLLPTHCVMKKDEIVKVHVGARSQDRTKKGVHTGCSCHTRTVGVPHKVLMLVGATGAGKTTLINGMANYILGVQWDDDFRFKLIAKPNSQEQTVSQTTCITAYTFYKESGSPLPYTLTVIDTPGFMGAGGMDRDKKIFKQIKELFSIASAEGIDELHGIGFVTPAPLARLTPTQQYVFTAILSVFGKDVSDNIFLMITFADGMRPPVLDAVKAAGVPNKTFFKFNNSALFASKSADDEFDRMFWKMGMKNFEEFFKHFSNAQAQSLQLSREVIQERETLKTTLQGLHPQIQLGLSKINELRQERQMLKDLEADILSNKDFIYRVEITKQRKIDLPPGTYTTNCLTCNYTCHKHCPYSDNDDKYKCAAMAIGRGTRSAACGVCPGRCSWMDHKNNSYQFELYKTYETRPFHDLKKKYESAMSSKEELELVINTMKKELDALNMAVLHKIDQARRSLERLQQIAMKPDPHTQVEYIDILIESEKLQANPGWLNRVKALKDVRKQAQIATQLTRNPKSQQHSFFSAEQEQSIWKKILGSFGF